MFDHIRKLFSQTQEAKVRGYLPGRFSFNVKGGRCEACAGDGTIKIEMHFLPDVYVPCEVCKGARYNRDTLDITFKGKNIAEVLDLSCEEALEFFANQPAIARHMQTLVDVGPRLRAAGPAGADAVGRRGPAGEAGQRAVQALAPATPSTSSTSPPPACTSRTSASCSACSAGWSTRATPCWSSSTTSTSSRRADWVIDLGPEGGDGGGMVVVEGPPEVVAKTPDSYTGQFLAPVLARHL